MSNDTQVHGLWTHSRAVVVTQPLLGLMFLLLARQNLFGSYSNAWDRALGFASAVLAGLLFGITLMAIAWRRMVQQHMTEDHPGLDVATKRPR